MSHIIEAFMPYRSALINLSRRGVGTLKKKRSLLQSSLPLLSQSKSGRMPGPNWKQQDADSEPSDEGFMPDITATKEVVVAGEVF